MQGKANKEAYELFIQVKNHLHLIALRPSRTFQKSSWGLLRKSTRERGFETREP
jgi:hypothetical protein